MPTDNSTSGIASSAPSRRARSWHAALKPVAPRAADAASPNPKEKPPERKREKHDEDNGHSLVDQGQANMGYRICIDAQPRGLTSTRGAT